MECTPLNLGTLGMPQQPQLPNKISPGPQHTVYMTFLDCALERQKEKQLSQEGSISGLTGLGTPSGQCDFLGDPIAGQGASLQQVRSPGRHD